MTYKTHMGDDLMVANAARVSFAKYTEVFRATDAQLICYLGKHKHWTPFAHPQIQVHVKAPIPIARQCFKHKVGFVENEISRRYVDTEPTFYLPDVWRKRNPDKKQGSLDEAVDLEFDVENCYKHCLSYYNTLLRRGVCPEQARLVLPQAMYTEWIWTGSLFAFARFHGLRNAPDAQKEVKMLAQQAGDIIGPLFPLSWEALKQ